MIPKLNYDEQFDAAIKLRYFIDAFVFNFQDSEDDPTADEIVEWRKIPPYHPDRPPFPERPFSYSKQKHGVYSIGTSCYVGCTTRPHDDTCTKKRYDQVLEDVFLKDKLSVINEMQPGYVIDGTLTKPFVFDIDLDYFHTRKAIAPDTVRMFYDLICKSEFITIAKECTCVKDEKYEDEDIDCEYLLERLLGHIGSALHKQPHSKSPL